MSSHAVNRIQDIIKRIDDNLSQSEAIKTCFGILAIMSREESSKQLIGKEGMETILNGMTSHVDKCDVQESGCDLLWSLAFNNSQVKENIAKYGGSVVLVRALKRYSKSAEFLKSACGALSNICQYRLNQEGVAVQGGLQPLVGAIHAHQSNGKLLPFVFDAIASLIVTNEENAKAVSTLGLIPLVISSLSKHKLITEVVKSGCHALAILSDVKGQASKVAFAGGVPVILMLLDMHPAYPDLHRVAAVVMLRMLQESIHVAREITCHEGVRILLKSLDKGGAQLDTVAAVTHILFTVTNPSSPASAAIEPQLWLSNKGNNSSDSKNKQSHNNNGNSLNDIIASIAPKQGGGSMDQTLGAGLGNIVNSAPTNNSEQTSLTGLVNVIGLYIERKDVVRAACRLLNNLIGFPGVVIALEKLFILDRIFECVYYHKESKDVVDSAATLLKVIHRRAVPTINGQKATTLLGILFLYGAKVSDEEATIACSELILKYLQSSPSNNAAPSNSTANSSKSTVSEELRLPNGKLWEFELISVVNTLISKLRSSSNSLGTDDDNASIGSTSSYKKVSSWNKNSNRLLFALVNIIEVIIGSKVCTADSVFEELFKLLKGLNENLTSKLNEIGKKIEKILGVLASILKIELQSKSRSVSVDVPTEGNSSPSSKSGVVALLPISPTSSKVDIKAPNSKTNSETTLHSNGSLSNLGNNNNSNNNNSNRTYKPNGPRHPLKFIDKFDPSKPAARLLDCWPNYLERLSIPPDQPLYRISNNPANNMTGLNVPERMHVVYDSQSAGGRGLQSRMQTSTPYTVPPEGVGSHFDHSLTFDSEFESGNLMTAIQRGDATYDLFLRADLHTSGQTQWFYFAVANTHPTPIVRLFEQGVQVPPVRVRFNIMNLQKPDSLFNLGMRPVIYSCTDASTKNIGWVRAGSDICYYSNSFSYGEGMNNYYSLSFTIEFHNPKDTVLIAYTYPYTMYDHKYYMNQILSKPNSQDIIRNFKLCTALSGEDCDLYVVTNFKDKERIGPLNAVDDSNSGRRSKDRSSPKSLKPAFFLSGRVHPGEPPASWMMKGILDFITSNSPQAQLLRQTFVIFVVPILNPDGVIYGNNRCCLAGVDLNRQWKVPAKSLHPTVFSLKSLMIAQKKIRDIYMYIDLHGHSRKYNVFMYGCDDKKKPRPQVREFPRFLSNHLIGRKYVSFEDSSFHIKKGRESTARVVVAKELNIPYSYTLEATFCGSNYGPLKHCHMNMGHLQEVGASLCDSILNYAITEGYVKDVVLRSIAPMDAIMAGSIENNSQNNNDGNVQYSSNSRNGKTELLNQTNNQSQGQSNHQHQITNKLKDLDSDSDNSDVDDGAASPFTTTISKKGSQGTNKVGSNGHGGDNSQSALRSKSSDESSDPLNMPKLQVHRLGSIGSNNNFGGGGIADQNAYSTSSNSSSSNNTGQSHSQLPQPPSGSMLSQTGSQVSSKNFRNHSNSSHFTHGIGVIAGGMPSESHDDMALNHIYHMTNKPSSGQSSATSSSSSRTDDSKGGGSISMIQHSNSKSDRTYQQQQSNSDKNYGIKGNKIENSTLFPLIQKL